MLKRPGSRNDKAVADEVGPIEVTLEKFWIIFCHSVLPLLPEELGKWWQPVDNLTMLRNLENLLSSILKPSLLQGVTSINCEMCEILFNRLDVTDLDSFTVFSETV